MNNSLPHVLVIANEALSQGTSNGRTLRNLFLGWSSECVAQIYLHGGLPDKSVCQTSFCCTDKMALDAFLRRKQRQHAEKSAMTSKTESRNRTAFTMLLRDLVWNSRRWATEEFWQWADAFSPEVILLQAGDCGFMFKLAADLSKRNRAPLVIYNSEGYYFKNYDYFRASGLSHCLYPLFRHFFRRQFRKTMRMTSHTIYLCDALRDAYAKEFSTPADVLYTVTELQPFDREQEAAFFSAAYLGNLGVGRHEPLIEIGAVLHELSDRAVLHVYGRAPSEEIRKKLERADGIVYHGVVPYETVKQVMEQSDLLVHAENFSAFYREDLKYAFSTKIADSLASGRCFLLYAPEEMACSSYLRQNEAAYVVSDRQALRETLRKLLDDPSARYRYLKRASDTVAKNHSQERNAVRFQEILKEVAKKYENSAG